MSDIISVTEAHDRFGDLAKIRNGVTTWIEIQDGNILWKPVFQGAFMLIGYRPEAIDAETTCFRA